MRRLLNTLRIAWRLSSNIPWVNAPEWRADDTASLRNFLSSQHGIRFRATLLNSILRQNAHMAGCRKGLEFEAGFSNGMRTMVHSIENLARVKEHREDFTSGEDGDDPLMSEDPTATPNRVGAMFRRG